MNMPPGSQSAYPAPRAPVSSSAQPATVLQGKGEPAANPRQAWSVLSLLLLILVACAITIPLVRTSDFFIMEQQPANFSQGSARLQLTFGLIFAIAGVICLRYSKLAWDTARHVNIMLWLFLLWCLLSVAWSPYPIVTIKRVVQQVGLVLLGLTLTLPFVPRHLLERAVWWTSMIILVASVLVTLVLPQMSIDTVHGYAWRGITWHKNTLGGIAALSVVLWLVALSRRWCTPMVGIFGLLFSVIMLALAKSSTAMLTAGIGITAWGLSRPLPIASEYHLRSIILVALTMVASLGLLVFVLFNGHLPTFADLAAPVAAIFRKSPDLTGRSDLWMLVMQNVRQHLWTGIGYGAFWLNVGSPSQYVIDALHWIPLQAHNGYLDLLNETGVIGLSLAIGVLLFHAGSLLRLTLGGSDTAPFHWAIFAIIVISNLSESQIFNGLMFQNILLLLSIVLVAHERADMHKQQVLSALASLKTQDTAR